MGLLIKPTSETFDKANTFIKIMDATKENLLSNSTFVSKTAKNIRSIKAPVLRYFEYPGQITSAYGEGEYDISAIFKLLKYESYFFKAVQKKMALLTKSGFGIQSENDEIKDYFEKRFMMMYLSTGKSLEYIIRQTAFYLITCCNAFVVKVRSNDCEFASKYRVDGKERLPVVGLFPVHPTTMKPKFKYKKEAGMWKAVLDKWVQINKRGQVKEFAVEDVVHFTLNKEDGMLLGTPDVVPVIDDIRTLRKMEEDIQLLIYRDLFPIIHYQVEKPQMIDHASGKNELEQAQFDMQRIIQDGGIATDKRHEINFVGQGGKGLDVTPFLEYFRQRVFTGLGVSALDMSDAASGGNQTTAQTASNQIIDAVKFIQQELAYQFKEQVLIEMAIQSPFNDVLNRENMPNLVFEEVDVEWKIRQENHAADLFTKNVKTWHEVRNKMGDKTASDEDLMYTHGSLYGQQPAHKTMLDTGYGDKYAQLQKKIDPPKPPAGGATASKSKPKKSAAKRDSIKASKTSSNVVKKKARDFILEDALRAGEIREEFVEVVTSLGEQNKVSRKLHIMMATKFVYDKVKLGMKDALLAGMEDAAGDLDLEDYDTRVSDDIYEPVDKLRDSVADMVYKDPESVKRAAYRIVLADRTEQSRAYNYGYALVCVNNNRNQFVICADHEDVAEDSAEFIGKEIQLTKRSILRDVPPFRPNSKLKIKVKEIEQDGEEQE